MQEARNFADEKEREAELRAIRARTDWKMERQDDENGAVVHSLSEGPYGFWLRVVAQFEASEWSELCDVLDEHIEQRQKEWHELLLPGGGVRHTEDPSRHVLYFAYRSPPLFRDRDCLYCKVAHREEEGKLDMFYWTIEDEERKLEELHGDRVRIEFRAAHFLQRNNADGTVRYEYIQSSDTMIKLPDFLLRGPQVSILMDEIKGLKVAVSIKKDGDPI